MDKTIHHGCKEGCTKEKIYYVDFIFVFESIRAAKTAYQNRQGPI